jgi:hypothetical protein
MIDPKLWWIMPAFDPSNITFVLLWLRCGLPPTPVVMTSRHNVVMPHGIMSQRRDVTPPLLIVLNIFFGQFFRLLCEKMGKIHRCTRPGSVPVENAACIGDRCLNLSTVPLRQTRYLILFPITSSMHILPFPTPHSLPLWIHSTKLDNYIPVAVLLAYGAKTDEYYWRQRITLQALESIKSMRMCLGRRVIL